VTGQRRGILHLSAIIPTGVTDEGVKPDFCFLREVRPPPEGGNVEVLLAVPDNDAGKLTGGAEFARDLRTTQRKNG